MTSKSELTKQLNKALSDNKETVEYILKLGEVLGALGYDIIYPPTVGGLPVKPRPAPRGVVRPQSLPSIRDRTLFRDTLEGKSRRDGEEKLGRIRQLNDKLTLEREAFRTVLTRYVTLLGLDGSYRKEGEEMINYQELLSDIEKAWKLREAQEEKSEQESSLSRLKGKG